MADPRFIAKGEFKSYKGRLTLYVFMISLVAGTGGLIIGYDIGISGGVTSMDSFLKKFFPSVYVKMKREESEIGNQYCKFDSQLLTTFTSSLYIAGLIASFFASAITRAFGRKVSMVTGGVSFFAGAVLNGAATNVAKLIVGRILLGFGVGFAGQAVPLYLSEMAPSNLRGALNICFQMFITVGILTANLVNYGTDQIKAGWGWRLSLGLAAVPAVIMTVGSVFFLPDTPSSLLERGHRERAMSSLRRLRGTEDVEDEFQDMVDASEASKLVNQPWRKILGRKYRAQLVMAMAIPFFQQITGINVVMFYAPVLFKTIGLGSSGSLMSAVITGLVNVVATFVSIFTVDRYGRRFLFIEGGIQMFICQVAIGIILGEKFRTSGNGQLSRGYANLVVLFICMYVSAFAWSWGPLGILVPSEIFPLEIRSVGQSINVSTNLLLTFAIAQAFLAMLCHLKFGLFFFFAGWVFIMTTFIYFFLPETKNIPIEEMAMVWKKHWFWGKILPDDDRYDGRGNGAGMEMDPIGN